MSGGADGGPPTAFGVPTSAIRGSIPITTAPGAPSS